MQAAFKKTFLTFPDHESHSLHACHRFSLVIYCLRRQEVLHGRFPAFALQKPKARWSQMTNNELFCAILSVASLMLTLYFGLRPRK